MIKIDARVVEAIIAQARFAVPIESCGYLAEKDGRVSSYYPLTNIDRAADHFSLDPAEQFDRVRRMREAGERLCAVYHSHPASPARPSAEDIRLAYDPKLSYVIVSLEGNPVIRSFRIQDGKVTEEEIVVEDRRRASNTSTSVYEIPASLTDEINELERYIEENIRGGITDSELKSRRVPFGVYEQRNRGAYMVRARCAAGIITPEQLDAVANISSQFGASAVHITTRQEVQIHDVSLQNMIPVIRALLKAGLATRGGGGNTLRNITASWDSGIAQNEIFDVTPHAVALTSRLIARSDSWLLPRKFKIAFSNTIADNAFAGIHDVGFVAATRDGARGFKVFVAGGLGAKSHAGVLLHDFVLESDVFSVAEAIKRVFSKYGNRKNKHAARLRFLWKTLGREKFTELYQQERKAIDDEGTPEFSPTQWKPAPPISSTDLSANVPPTQDTEGSREFLSWKTRYAFEQKQKGLFSVRVPIVLGILKNEHAVRIAAVMERIGADTIRFTPEQNIALRNIPEHFLGEIFSALRGVVENWHHPAFFGNAVVCAGADTCQLGLCLSRGALGAVIRRLSKSTLDLDRLGDFRFHLSGCPNACGRHPIADLGFFGRTGRKGQRMYPAYSIVGGSATGADGMWNLAENIDEINARDLPVFLEKFLSVYLDRKDVYSTFREYLDAEGKDAIRRICGEHRGIPEFNDDKNYYYDWGASDVFSLAGRGTGECSAGLFDLIEIDLGRIRDLRIRIEGGSDSPDDFYMLALASCRMLLITRGAEAADEQDVFDLFDKYFLKNRLIADAFQPVVDVARTGNRLALHEHTGSVIALSHAVEALYLGMDDSLKFPVEKEVHISAEFPSRGTVDLVKDLRGVACPMNFVKTKMALAQLSLGAILEVWLDDGAPIENVPRSVAAEGHEVLSQEKDGGHWRVVVRKAK